MGFDQDWMNHSPPFFGLLVCTAGIERKGDVRLVTVVGC